MNLHVRTACVDDVPVLIALMAEFYGESGYSLPRDTAARACRSLLNNPRHGRILLVEVDQEVTGYIVLTLGFSIEHGGLRGFVDDFFVRPEARGRGFGTAALEAVKQACRDLGVRALLVEAGPANHRARSIYARAGFEENGRTLLGQSFAPALHDV